MRIEITGKDKCFDWSKLDKFMQDALMAGIKAEALNGRWSPPAIKLFLKPLPEESEAKEPGPSAPFKAEK